MTDDPMQKKLAEIAKQMEEEKTIERAIEMGGRALDILMKKISESETWKTGIYYA